MVEEIIMGVCKSCIDPHRQGYVKQKREVIFMKCEECGGEQFFTQRENHVPVAYVCDGCGITVPIKSSKKEKKSWALKATDNDSQVTTDS
jgi:hypothetical protein